MEQLITFITRAQPLHLGHEYVIDNAMVDLEKTGGHLVIFVGSSNKSREFKNPLTIDERVEMIEKRYQNIDNLHVVPLPDFDYDDEAWENNFHYKLLQVRAELFGGRKHKVVLVSSVKCGDDLLRASWARDVEVIGIDPLRVDEDEEEPFDADEISATEVRDLLSRHEPSDLTDFLSKPVRDLLGTYHEALHNIKASHYQVFEYREMWKNTPFPVQFAATDVVVRDVNGDILMIERGGDFAQGKKALVGGFLEQDLTNEQNIKKELLEEVNLNLDNVEHHIVLSWHCDAIGRASRGRMTTTVFLIQLGAEFQDLDLKAGDDAAGLGWGKPEDYLQLDLFNDHAGLIRKVLKLESQGVTYVPHS